MKRPDKKNFRGGKPTPHAEPRQFIASGKTPSTVKLRIVGGEFRGRTIEYSGDPRTRPMKDSIREALFNLVGGFVPGRCAIDLFAGTGAVGLEALSRGATQALLVERHFPTARLIKQNLNSLKENLPATVFTQDTFFWIRQFLKDTSRHPSEPWMVFFCPPYSLYRGRTAELMNALTQFYELAPAGSVLVVEAPEDFSPDAVPHPSEWRWRHYPPAILGVWRPKSYDNAVGASEDAEETNPAETNFRTQTNDAGEGSAD